MKLLQNAAGGRVSMVTTKTLLRVRGFNVGSLIERSKAMKWQLRMPGPAGRGVQPAKHSRLVACTNATSAITDPETSVMSLEGETATFTIEKERIIYTRRDLLLTTLADSMGECEGVRMRERG